MILDVNGLEKYDDEILPDGVYDIKCRQVPTNKMQVYRGLPGQITVDPKDKNRLTVWYGASAPLNADGTTNGTGFYPLGACEQVLYKSDLLEGVELNVKTRTLNEMYITDIEDHKYDVDTNNCSVYFIDIDGEVTINVNDLNTENATSFLRIIIFNKRDGSRPIFKGNIRWLNSMPPVFKTAAGKTTIIQMFFNGSMWTAFAVDDNNTAKELNTINECVLAGSHMTGWVLPQGSEDGEINEYYTCGGTNLGLSSDELDNVAIAAFHIGNIVDVANNINIIDVVEDNLEKLQSLASQIDHIDAIGTNINKIITVEGSLSSVNTVAANVENVNAIGNNISNVNDVANDISKIITLHEKLGNVNTVAANIDTINITADYLNSGNALTIEFSDELTKDKLSQNKLMCTPAEVRVFEDANTIITEKDLEDIIHG